MTKGIRDALGNAGLSLDRCVGCFRDFNLGNDMSYDIDIFDEDGNVIEFSDKHDIIGGTYEIGGTSRAHLNITYNYAPHYYKHIDAVHGIRALYGMKASKAATVLFQVIQELGIDRDDDYWKDTPGNAGHALFNLMTLCLMAPNGYLRGD